MKSTLRITNIIFISLIIQSLFFSVLGQTKDTASIPPKCCDPMKMPLNGKCETVKCRNDDYCIGKYKGYCAKYNKGQALCRFISGVCGCNGELSALDKKPTPPNCPKDQTCGSDGKCAPSEKPCDNKYNVLVNGKCQAVHCRNDDFCKKSFQAYCTKFKMGNAFCRAGTDCGCQGQKDTGPQGKKLCNRNLNGNDMCAKGEICMPSGNCEKQICVLHGGKCDPKGMKCCNNIYCHKRNHTSGHTCVNVAFTGEPCGSASGGIPCQSGYACINGKCSTSQKYNCGSGSPCTGNQKCTEIKRGNTYIEMCI